jgi:hypothetical protein
MLTVLGSVASRFAPREVATGSCVAGRFSVGTAVAGRAVSEAATVAAKVSLGITVTGCTGLAVELAGAQAARKMANRLRLIKKRLFLIWL